MTFGVLLWWRDAGPAESRTGWFLVAVRGLDDDGAGALDGQSALNRAFYWNRADRALDGRRLLA